MASLKLGPLLATSNTTAIITELDFVLEKDLKLSVFLHFIIFTLHHFHPEQRMRNSDTGLDQGCLRVRLQAMAFEPAELSGWEPNTPTTTRLSWSLSTV